MNLRKDHYHEESGGRVGVAFICLPFGRRDLKSNGWAVLRALSSAGGAARLWSERRGAPAERPGAARPQPNNNPTKPLRAASRERAV